jgi:hypothetical protein
LWLALRHLLARLRTLLAAEKLIEQALCVEHRVPSDEGKSPAPDVGHRRRDAMWRNVRWGDVSRDTSGSLPRPCGGWCSVESSPPPGHPPADG